MRYINRHYLSIYPSGAKILEREERSTSENQAGQGVDPIRKEPNCTYRDGGAYSLPTAYDRLLVTYATSCDYKPDEARRWRTKCHI